MHKYLQYNNSNNHLQHELFFLSFPPLGRPWPIRIFCCPGRSKTSFCAFLELKTRSVIARNISSTLIFSFAEVSKSWMPIWVAKRPASSRKTTRRSGSSHLLPTNTRATSSQFWLISCNHLKLWVNELVSSERSERVLQNLKNRPKD